MPVGVVGRQEAVRRDGQELPRLFVRLEEHSHSSPGLGNVAGRDRLLASGVWSAGIRAGRHHAGETGAAGTLAHALGSCAAAVGGAENRALEALYLAGTLHREPVWRAAFLGMEMD